jgi:DNA adenine methylase
MATKRARKVRQPGKGFGSKYYLANWIHAHAPRVYTHRNVVFAGRLGEYWNWQPIEGISEAVNDANGLISNFFYVLQRYRKDLSALLEHVPFSEVEWISAKTRLARELTKKNKIRMAADLFIVMRQSRLGIGKDYATPTKRIRRGMHEHASAWLSGKDSLQEASLRIQRTEVRNLDFEPFIHKYDHRKALFYCDPPYLHSTRQSVGQYGDQEMSLRDHKRLLRILAGIDGKFMLSGYDSPLYERWRIRHGFHVVKRRIDNKASNKKVKPTKIECLWTNYKTAA